MRNAAVESMVNNMKELVDHQWHLIGDYRGHMVRLQRDLLEIHAFHDNIWRSMEWQQDGLKIFTEELVKEIDRVVYEVEDIIDVFVNETNNSEVKLKSSREISLLRKFFKIPLGRHTSVAKMVDLHTVSKMVEDLRKRVQWTIPNLKAEHEYQFRRPWMRDVVGFEDEADGLINRRTRDSYRRPRMKDVVGFEDEADDLINSLTRDSNCLEVISLVGMPGAGKTTLAWKVFNDPKIGREFPVRIWLSISQEFSDRDVFLSILKELATITKEIESKADCEIADLIIAHLDKAVSFLIVMDDVWDTAWHRLQAALPNHNKGKVLITSRHEQVGRFPSRTESIKKLRYFYEEKKLRYFHKEESRKLLLLEWLNTLDCSSEFEFAGIMIAEHCEGLPLSVVIIGGVLAANIRVARAKWEEVSTWMEEYFFFHNQQMPMMNLISWSYDILPSHLRSCFLYLGMFHEDHEIPASRLIRMWIGEGFIQHSESCSLEETGEQYLEELIKRNLVRCHKFKHDGKVKTCRIHNSLRDFCLTEASNEIKYVSPTLTHSISDIYKYRHLSIHFNFLSFISSKPYCPHARSFVCFSKDKNAVSKRNSSKFFAAFKFLKVLDVQPLVFEEIDTNIYQLVYMRYLVLSSNLSVLGSEFSQLWNIHTLIIHTTSRTLEVKADIWKMNKLRYFKTNAPAILPKPSKIGEYGKELQRLGRISVESCTPELFSPGSNLKRLGIRGNLSLLFSGRSGSFDRLGKMEDIEKLELINDVYPFPSSEWPLRGLPRHHQFPSGLMSLTLRATFLSWDDMSTLALLKKLEVLKLKENAFMGTTWNGNADDGGFKCLQLLHIEDTDLIIWEASSLCYPKLTSLVLRNCEKLLAIPNGIADIPSLQTLELYMCRSAAASAKAIKEAKIKTQPQGSAFMLSIFPPIEY